MVKIIHTIDTVTNDRDAMRSREMALTPSIQEAAISVENDDGVIAAKKYTRSCESESMALISAKSKPFRYKPQPYTGENCMSFFSDVVTRLTDSESLGAI